MKKILFLLLFFSFSFIVTKAQPLYNPVMGTNLTHPWADEAGDVWYYIKFKNGGGYIQDMGSNTNLKTQSKNADDEQLWKFTGTLDECVIESKSGRKMNFSGSNFKSGSSSTSMKLIKTTNSTYIPAWEIQRITSSNSMNQWGGAGIGKELGEWTTGDPNNPLIFIPFKGNATKYPVVSTEDDSNETWYYLWFLKGNMLVRDMGEGEPLASKELTRSPALLWKITGTEDNYTIVNKTGRRIALAEGVYTASDNDVVTFSIGESTNRNYDFPMVLKNTISGRYFSQVESTGAVNSIGENAALSNAGNALAFVRAEDIDINELDAEIMGKAATPESKFCLWYREPATVWMTHALPIGNGQFGGMVFGGIRNDEIQFNDKTLWTGDKTSYGSYQNFGNLYIKNEEILSVTDYRRELDIENAMAKVSYKIDGVKYIREYFTSYPDNVIVIHYTASEPGKIDADLELQSGHNSKVTYNPDGSASFSGKLSLLSYKTKMQVVNNGGELTRTENGIQVNGANSMTVILRGITNYDENNANYIYNSTLLADNLDKIIEGAAEKSYESLKSDHIQDYKSLFDRIVFDLDGTSNTVPTDELINNYNKNKEENKLLEVLYFHYGRYLMIGSARGGVSLPSNLQGIWNHRNDPPWNSDIHSNINVQMNYWPAEATNLSDLHMTFLNYIYNEAVEHTQWKQNAKDAGQTKGWTLYTENNIFGWHGGFASNYVIANAWYCMHIWQHYRYTLDEDYLKNIAFPVMKSCCDFWLERLIKDRVVKDGTWVCPDEYSPEHGPAKEDGVAHAQQLVWDLFNNTLNAIEIIGEEEVEAAFLADLKDKFQNLDKGLAVQSNGQLKEWKYSPNSISSDTEHRHMSHLVGLHPGNQISPLVDKTIFNAAVKSLKDRGDEGCGWAMGWKVNLWSRALDGDHAHKMLQKALKLSTTTTVNQYAGGVYPNLLDACAPFQIDGNFGACSGITEMLLQSHMDILQILPALPSSWKKGNIQGLRAVGAFIIGIKWDDERTSITIHSDAGKDCEILYPGIKIAEIRDGSNNKVDFTVIDDNQIKFATEPGQTYLLISESGGTSFGKPENQNSTIIQQNGNTIIITGENIEEISIYNVAGQIIDSKRSNFVFYIPLKGSFLVSITYADNTKEVKKVLIC